MFQFLRSLPCVVAASLTLQMAAQSGPAGVGSSANNVLWLGADHGVFSDAGITPAVSGANVLQWSDRSGNGRHAFQATLTNRPNYIAGALNGKPVMRFTAANTDRMLATGISTANRASVWVVARYSSLPSPNPGVLQGAAPGDAYSATPALKNMGMWVSSATTQVWGRGIQADGTSRNVTMATALAVNTPYVMNTVYRQTAISQYVNHGPAGSVASDGTLRSWTDMAIGAQAGTEVWNGDIAEVIVFNVDVNEAQRLIVTSYLAAKYGMTLTASTDVYREDQPARGNYDHEVAGIGRTSVGNLHTDARGTGIVQISNPTGLGNNEFLIWGHDNGVLGAWGVGDVPTGLEGRFQRTWRASERNTTGTASVDVGAVDITFDLSGLGPVDPAELRLLVDSDQDGSFADEVPLEGAWNVSGNQYRFSAVTALVDGSRFTLGTTDLRSTPLPVELLFFEVEGNGPVVNMTWATASEQGNDRFNVERSADGSEWIDVVEVTGAGTSNQLLQYSAVDEQPLTGINFYRLRQTDLDGTMTWSDVRSLMRTITEADGPFVSPNPTDGPVVLSWPAGTPLPEHIQVLDASGRGLAVEQHPLGANGLTLDLAPFPPGIYVIRLEQAGRPKSIRVLR
jgi:hypothetical protein